MALRILHLALWLVVFLPAQMAYSQSATGMVVDKSDNEPVVGATVRVVSSTRYIAITGPNGRYNLDLPEGVGKGDVLVFEVSAIGFETRTDTIPLVATETVYVIDFELASSTTNLGLAVVSAGKFEQDLSEVTVSMEVLRPGLIESKNTLNMDEALQQTPGVVIVDSEPQIRGGSGFSFGAGSRVQIMVDDLPMLSGDAGRPIWGFLPVQNVEQVEVIKGASSVLYGSAALSGVINVRTARPGPEPKTRIQSYHGLYSDPGGDHKYWDDQNMLSGVNAFHSRRLGRLDLTVGMSLLSNDSYKGPIHDSEGALPTNGYDPLSIDTYDGDQRARLSVSTRYQPTSIKGLSFGLNGSILKGESVATLLWENDSTGLFSSFGAGTDANAATRTKQVVSILDPFVEYLSDNGWRHALRGRWQSLDNDNNNNQGNFSDVYYGSYQLQKRLDSVGAGLTFTGGVTHQYTDGRGDLYTGGNTNGDNTASNSAVYLQADQKIGQRFNLSAGIRYEHFSINGESESKPVFRTGANYKLAEATFLRASFGQGYRFPSIAEKFITTSVGIVQVYSNPELQSETSFNAEIGVKQGFQIGEFKGYLDVAGFLQRFENFIEFTFSQWSPDPTFENLFGLGFKSVNTGDAQVAGADLSIMGTGYVGKVKLDVLAGYTYIEPTSLNPDEVYANSPADEDDLIYIEAYENISFASTSSDPSDNILKYRMQHVIRADVMATYGYWTLGASWRYNSAIQNIDKAFVDFDSPGLISPGADPLLPTGIRNWQSEHTGGDNILDARVSYAVNDHHKVALVVNNVMNRIYAIRPLAVEPNRSIIMQYIVEF